MRLYTDGKRVELLTADGQVSWAPKGKPTLKDAGGRAATKYGRDGLLTITDAGTDLTAQIEEIEAVDAIGVGKDQAVALIDDEGTVHLVCGPVGQWEIDIPLGEVDAEPLSWPNGVIWEPSVSHDQLYSEAKGMGFPIDGALKPNLSANAHGYAVTSVVTGLVAVVRPGSEQIDFALRLPAQPEAQLYAEPTAQGVVVTLVIEGRQGAVLHLTPEGEVLGVCAAFGAAPALLLGEQVVVYDDEDNVLRLCDMALEQQSKKALNFRPVEAISAASGKAFALANDTDVALCKVTPKGRVSIASHINYAQELAAARKRAAAKRLRDTYDPKRAHGDPALGFPAGRKPPPWVAKAGEPLALKLLVRSTGGKGRGMFVALEGDALQTLDLSHAEVGDTIVPFEQTERGVRADIPDVELVVGLRYPLDPSPKNDKHKLQAQELLAATHFSLTVHGRANEPGRELLRVTLGALESQASPMKWMRPLIVEA